MCTVAFCFRPLWIWSEIVLILEKCHNLTAPSFKVEQKVCRLDVGRVCTIYERLKVQCFEVTHPPSPDPGKGSCCHQLIVHQVPSVWWKCPTKAVSLYHPLTLLTMTNNWMRSGFLSYLLLASISSLVGSSDDSSLFEASKALSSSYWEQYRTLSQPADDLMQCLARCELHENHPDYSG